MNKQIDLSQKKEEQQEAIRSLSHEHAYCVLFLFYCFHYKFGARI